MVFGWLRRVGRWLATFFDVRGTCRDSLCSGWLSSSFQLESAGEAGNAWLRHAGLHPFHQETCGAAISRLTVMRMYGSARAGNINTNGSHFQ
jgi:hypothetical protein